MENIFIGLLTVVLVVVCLLIVLIVLMQRPKQEGLGAAFGGGMTDQMFGAQTTNVLQKATVYLAVMFFGITLILAVLVARKQNRDSRSDRKITADEPAVPPTTTVTPDVTTSTTTTPPIQVSTKPGEGDNKAATDGAGGADADAKPEDGGDTPTTTETPGNAEADATPEAPESAPAGEAEGTLNPDGSGSGGSVEESGAPATGEGDAPQPE